ncbi:MAG: hypothetical protein L6Q38_18000, partial [Nitrospira sp.]|nr:hypothetical protein [Nitrospira sp.]
MNWLGTAKPFGSRGFAVLHLILAWMGLITTPAPGSEYLSPTALGVSPDGGTIYVACATAGKVLAVDSQSRA